MFDDEDILSSNDFDFCKYSPEAEVVNSPQYIGTAQFLIIWGVIQFGLFFGALFTAWIYGQGAHLRETIDEIFTPEDIPYEKKYQVGDVDGCDKIPSENSYMFENTPDGSLYMNYCQKDDGFGYWADKNIRFSYLEAAARKFVNQFGCKQLYIERECNKENDTEEEENVEQNCQDTTEDTTEDNDEEESKSSGPFAQLKKYNTKNLDVKQDKPTVEDNSCKFIKRGKLVDFNIPQQAKFEEPNQKMTFESFKAMFG